MADPAGTMPSLIEPQLVTLASRAPTEGQWSYEIKFDGYRMLCRIENGTSRLFTRNGHDWTDRLSKLLVALNELPIDEAWLDAEAVVLNSAGMPDFNALQNAFDRRSTSEILLFVFDLMYLNGTDQREQPLHSRRAVLSDLMGEVHSDLLRYSEDFAQDPASLVASACKMQLEGIIGKRTSAPYRSGRSTDWIKLKCRLRQEFVVAGFTRLKGAKTGVRSLLLGVYEPDGSLRFAGTAKQNLRPSQLSTLQRKAKPLARTTSAFSIRRRRTEIGTMSGWSRSLSRKYRSSNGHPVGKCVSQSFTGCVRICQRRPSRKSRWSMSRMANPSRRKQVRPLFNGVVVAA